MDHRRRANAGEWYTKEQFAHWYKQDFEYHWDRAGREAVPPGASQPAAPARGSSAASPSGGAPQPAEITVASFNFGFEQAMMTGKSRTKHCSNFARVCARIVEEADVDLLFARETSTWETS